MGYARVCSVALLGVVGVVVAVEADLTAGLPCLIVSGLPDAALSESRDRVRAAVVNSGERWPQQRLTVNLLPAHLPKHGSGFDVAVAMAIMAAAGAVPAQALDGAVLLGELGLDGTVRPVRGVLPAVLAAARSGVRHAVVPMENAAEAQLVPGLSVHGVDTLARLVRFARTGGGLLDPSDLPEPQIGPPPAVADLADVLGQERGRRAVTLAAAGGHHLAMFGPPGAGKTMLARRLPGILPQLDDAGAQEVTAIHSIAGMLPTGSPLLRRPPFQAPHHTASEAALVGGGSGLARPGALSLAHLGVLLLDEAPEFRSSVLNALRQPLEEGEVRLRRAAGETVYPARVQLVIAANPCPCANAAGDQYCQCSALVRRRYLDRLSGPLMDRVDLQVTLQPVRAAALLGDQPTGETSASIADRVRAARAAAAARWSRGARALDRAAVGRAATSEGTSAPESTATRLGMVTPQNTMASGGGVASEGGVTLGGGATSATTGALAGAVSNATVDGAVLRSSWCRLPRQTLRPVARAVDQGRLSARGYNRVIRISWSIADLEGRDRPDAGDVAEALALRIGSRR